MNRIKHKRRVVRSITIIGRRWFQSSAGNTYNSASILINGEHVHYTGRQYGYGDYYAQAAWDYLVKQFKLDADDRYNPRLFCEKHGIAYFAQAADVGRECDL